MSKACFDCPQNISDCYREHCIAADGVSRAVAVVNRQFPGPSITASFITTTFVVQNEVNVDDKKRKTKGF